MLSNRILQQAIEEIYEIIGVPLSIISLKGVCIASIGVLVEEATYLLEVKQQDKVCYTLAIHGEVAESKMVTALCVKQIESLLTAYQKKMDRNQFIQRILLNEFPDVEIYNHAKKIGIETEGRQVVFLIEPKAEGDQVVMETMKSLYITGTKDFITAIDERNIIFIKALDMTKGEESIQQIAKTILDTLSAEAMVKVRVAYGTIVEGLKEIKESYKEAMMALEVGRIFYSERSIVAYSSLGIGRLIHGLPKTLCESFLKEVFAKEGVESFDEETIGTAHQFFAHNLNISETARVLFIHRNTLVYRLDKIQKVTGLDVRGFEDAMIFKIALMVSEHMQALPFRET